MEQVFPYANIVAGILVLIIGFGLHWIGQLIAVLNRDLAVRLGIWEKQVIPEYEHFELGIAMADVLLGWIYGIAAIGLILEIDWIAKLAWFPAVVMIYHGLSAWFWTANQKKAGRKLLLTENPLRIIWCLSNFISGVLIILNIWNL